MDYKLFKVTYNDGLWHSGDFPSFYYIAKSETEVIANSEKYKEFLQKQNKRGGDIWISEMNRLDKIIPECENFDGFTMIIEQQEKGGGEK